MKFRLALSVTLLLMIITTLTFNFVGASPQRQSGDFIPTPTPYPVGEAEYEMTIVGGEDVTEVFDRATYGDFNVYETHVNSNYPRGMEFSVTADSAAGDITAVRLSIVFHGGNGERVQATQNEEGVWIAKPWENGDGQPAWTAFDFKWVITDEAGNQIETDPIAISYWDPAKPWTRYEFDSFIVYVHDYERAYSAEELGQHLYTSVESTEPRRIEAFGGPLPYKPIAVIYASVEELTEIYGAGVRNPTSGGFTNNGWGITVQYFNSQLEGEMFRTKASASSSWQDCVWADPEFNPDLSADNGRPLVQVSLDFPVFQAIPHEFTHLYQFEYNVTGPQWWTEGQANYHSYSAMNVVLPDQRLSYLATIDPDFPSIEDESAIPRNTPMADGCLYLVYHLGHSFINWFATTYGMEAYAQVNQMNGQRSGVSIFEAMEEVTGEDFFDIENKWREYLGFPSLTLADVDPASALEAPVDALYAEGDSVTLGATPIQNIIYVDPGENKLANGSCFANTKITILRVGSLNGINYYEIDCQGQIGWFNQSQLPTP